MASIFTLTCSAPPDNLPAKEEVVSNMKIKGDYIKNDIQYFLKFFADMQNAVSTKDTEKSFSYYADDFGKDSNINLSAMKKNIEFVNQSYKDINYTMKDLKVYIKGNEAISYDSYTYSAQPINMNLKPLAYSGKERIYWIKAGNSWKIVNWVYEE